MIRSVIATEFKAGTSPAQVRELMDAMAGVRVPGMRRLVCGPDLGLREGNWDYALTVDFDDSEAYKAYDMDPEHNRIRREIAAEITKSSVRVQFELPDTQGDPSASRGSLRG